MNENIPPIPPGLPTGPTPPQPPTWRKDEPPEIPLGEDPADRTPIPNTLAAIESLLRHPRRLMFQMREPGLRNLVPGLLLVTLLCSAIYGIIAGTFSGGSQLWAAPVKIAGGLFVAGAICLPSLYIFTCLSGSQARLGEVAGLLAGFLTLMTIMLVGFAPVALIFSQSTESVSWMGVLHLAFWAVATFFGVRFITAGFSHSQGKNHIGLNVWILIFMMVSLQMTTALRPILGTAPTFFPKEKRFFIIHWMDCLDQEDKAKKTDSASN